MPSSSSNASVCLAVRSLGPVAARVIAGGGDMRVTAVFERSLYAAGGEGRLACFLRDDMEEGPLNALCGGWPESRAVAAAGDVLVKRPGMFCGKTLVLDVSAARFWPPPPKVWLRRRFTTHCCGRFPETPPPPGHWSG